MAKRKPKLRAVCSECADRRYTHANDNPDGSTTFRVCPCTGLTREALEKFCATLGRRPKPKLKLVKGRVRS